MKAINKSIFRALFTNQIPIRNYMHRYSTLVQTQQRAKLFNFSLKVLGNKKDILTNEEIIEIITQGTQNLPKVDQNGDLIDYEDLVNEKLISYKKNFGVMSKQMKVQEVWRAVKDVVADHKQGVIQIKSISEEPQAHGINNSTIANVTNRYRELLAKFPDQHDKINEQLQSFLCVLNPNEQLILDNTDVQLRRISKRRQFNFTQQVEKQKNMTFEDQVAIQKKLVTAKGEDSDYESDVEESGAADQLNSPIISGKQEKKQLNFLEDTQQRKRIFQYLRIQDKNVLIPDKTKKDTLTVFMEIDDVLLHTFIYDENFGFMADPAAKEPEHKLLFGEPSGRQIPIHVYYRDHMQEFLDFLKQNKNIIEPILYTSGVPEYTNMLLSFLDPKNEIFQIRLFQPACYIFEKKDEDIFQMVKDISRFKNRDMARSIMLDPQPLNFLLCPENGFPIVKYNAELDNVDGQKDSYLLAIIEQLKDLAKMEDVRPFLRDSYKVRQVLKNSKLI
ncbi:nli interacting factor-like phosphatase family protein [Stylonychia lemnae]|uniref:Mitochondrial import inner membrane translocase subunit TIM50 n=1 Tax=Stylonychia lemnae TaxID=5949 RepID=A0A078ANL2_STYLE|nr:nli interacting factor-like phosphatase family protein [Stylonychia lemnae]|eukprot:CDW83521.1 nli interacting factor-like phosphatase family protein [Stylonychia lemnae]